MQSRSSASKPQARKLPWRGAEDLEIAKEVGDREGEGSAYGGLGIAHESLGNFSQAIKYHTQHLEIAKEVGSRAGDIEA